SPPSPQARNGRAPSPDAHAITLRHIELVTGPDAECVVPGIDIANDAIDPVLLRRVRVRNQIAANGIRPALGAEALRISKEVALLAGEAVEDRRRLAFERTAIRIERDQRAAEVGDVLTHGEIAVDMHAAERREA